MAPPTQVGGGALVVVVASVVVTGSGVVVCPGGGGNFGGVQQSSDGSSGKGSGPEPQNQPLVKPSKVVTWLEETLEYMKQLEAHLFLVS